MTQWPAHLSQPVGLRTLTDLLTSWQKPHHPSQHILGSLLSVLPWGMTLIYPLAARGPFAPPKALWEATGTLELALQTATHPSYSSHT